MLGCGKLAVRVGGIYALERLASEQPVEYHIQIMNLLCALIRHPSEDAHHSDAAPAGDLPKCCWDVELAAQVLGRCGAAQHKIEMEKMWRADLREANLRSTDLTKAKLDYANLLKANLTSVNLRGACLGLANLSEAHLIQADLSGTNMLMVNLNDALLAGTILANVQGLTQNQLNQAKSLIDNLPNLTNSFCAETGNPLVWGGTTINRRAP